MVRGQVYLQEVLAEPQLLELTQHQVVEVMVVLEQVLLLQLLP
tara:strand:+ start:82 stop:210 length:129 start_codon:yes stop_codon:yes gene_type:complete